MYWRVEKVTVAAHAAVLPAAKDVWFRPRFADCSAMRKVLVHVDAMWSVMFGGMACSSSGGGLMKTYQPWPGMASKTLQLVGGLAGCRKEAACVSECRMRRGFAISVSWLPAQMLELVHR